MRILKLILISVCLLKIISFSLYLIFNQDNKEIEKFFETELSRKYNDHTIDRGYIGGYSENHKVISKDSADLYLTNPREEEWPEFKRSWFQNYARYLRGLDTVRQIESNINIIRYP